MDQSQEVVEETVESVNPMDLDPPVSDPSRSARSEHVSTEALLKILRIWQGLRLTHGPHSSNRFGKKAWSRRIPWYKFGGI